MARLPDRPLTPGTRNTSGRAPLTLFGACDRHNLGDLVFPHVIAALLPEREVVVAGLAARDLRACGGHLVQALASVAEASRGQPATLLHVGGEVLTCDAWQAAVMLLTPDEARAVIARFDAHPRARRHWARQYLGVARAAPYVAGRGEFAQGGRLFTGIGGTEFAAAENSLREEVLASLREARFVGVRDAATRDALAGAGVRVRLAPDPAVMVAALFGEDIRRRGEAGEVAAVREAFPEGYLALQFSADFGDDATLAIIADQLDRATAETGLGLALFRAGAAPWHDDIAVYRRLAERLRGRNVRIFRSLHIRDICALIAASRGFCGSSLHGRIVAAAFALPRVSIARAGAPAPSKQAAFVRTWEPEELRGIAPAAGIAAAIRQALKADRPTRHRAAARLVSAFMAGLSELKAVLETDA